MATGGLLTNLAVEAVLDQRTNLVAWVLYGSLGSVLSLAARFSTMRAQRLSRTARGAERHARGAAAPAPRSAWPGRELASEGPAAHWTVVPGGDDGVPRQVGAFAIHALLRRDGPELLLLGEDAPLGRRVWVWWRPLTAEPLPQARRDLARGGRLRWLSAGTEGDGRWDAFVAPEGASLADWVAASGPLDWAGARLLLEGLADELDAAAADETRPPRLSIEQVWLGVHGRVQLLDWPLTGPREAIEKADGAAVDEPALALLRQAAARVLEGPARPPEEARRPIRAILPLHARRLVARLTGGLDSYQSLAELRADLAATRGWPAEATSILRAFHLAISFSFVALGACMMIGWSRNGAIVQALGLDRAMLQAQALREVLHDEQLAPPLLAELSPDDPLRAATQEQVRLLDERRSRDRQEQEVRLASLGWLGYLEEAVPHFRLRRTLAGADEPLRITRRPGAAYAVEVVRLRLPEEKPLVLETRAWSRPRPGRGGKPGTPCRNGCGPSWLCSWWR